MTVAAAVASTAAAHGQCDMVSYQPRVWSEIDRMPAQLRHPGLKADSRTQGRLLKNHGHGLATEKVELSCTKAGMESVSMLSQKSQARTDFKPGLSQTE